MSAPPPAFARLIYAHDDVAQVCPHYLTAPCSRNPGSSYVFVTHAPDVFVKERLGQVRNAPYEALGLRALFGGG